MAKYLFKNKNQVFKYMDKKIIEILNKCSDLALEKLTQNVLDTVYDWQPKQYERSYQLLESISRTEVRKVYGRYVVEIYFDYKKMQPIINDGKWNSHADFYGNWINNEQSASDMVNWLEYGVDPEHNQYYAQKAHGFLKMTIEDLQKNYRKIFKAYAKQCGVPVE